MKAIILNDTGDLQEAIVALPKPNSNEILIKIMAAGFNPIDYQMRENELERKLLHSPILGRELSGIIVEIGNEVKDFKIGDTVFCGSGSMGSNGTYAEYIAVPEMIVAHKPTVISFEQAAGIPSVGLTALQLYNRMQLKATDTLFIAGAAGGVGAMLVKILLANKFHHFVVTAGNEESIKSLKEIGLTAQQIINYKKEDVLVESISRNNDKKFDYVVDLVGNTMAEIAAELVKLNGTYLDVTALSTVESREILFNKGAVIMNISNYAYAKDKEYSYYKNGLLEVARLIESEQIAAPAIEIIGTLTIETIEKAHEMLRQNRTHGRKLIMQIQNI